jgi:hypothetical protein
MVTASNAMATLHMWSGVATATCLLTFNVRVLLLYICDVMDS